MRQSPEHDFSNVWLWRDWPDLEQHGFTKQDSGIDLIANQKESGKLWAIQCKFYQEGTSINRKEVDSFLATARGETFSQRLIVTTTYEWGKNAKEILFRSGKDCLVIDPTDLNSVPYDWSGRAKKQQLEAVAKAQKHFASN